MTHPAPHADGGVSTGGAGFSTGGWVAAPAAGRIIERIAPFLAVQRRADFSQMIQVETPPLSAGDEQ